MAEQVAGREKCFVWLLHPVGSSVLASNTLEVQINDPINLLSTESYAA